MARRRGGDGTVDLGNIAVEDNPYEPIGDMVALPDPVGATPGAPGATVGRPPLEGAGLTLAASREGSLHQNFSGLIQKPFLQKGTILYDNEQSFGAGSSVVASDHDRIRWQSEALWPAYWTQDSVPNSDPGFVERPYAFLGQGAGVQYAGPKVHNLIFGKNEYNPNTEFGEYNQKFDLYIDIEEFVEHYGLQYNITAEEFNNISNEALPSQILQFTNFLIALRELYGLHIKPVINYHDMHREIGPPPNPADFENQMAFLTTFMSWNSRARAFEEEAQRSFISGFFKRYRDHVTEVPSLMTEAEVEHAGLIYHPGIAHINPVYNYLLLDYEKVLESKVKSLGVTHAIPSLYVLTRESMNDERIAAHNPWQTPEALEVQEDFKNFATVGGLIRGVRPRVKEYPSFGVPGASFERKSYSSKQYFCSWTQAVDKILPFRLNSDRSLPPGRETIEQLAATKFRHAIADFQYLIIPPEEMKFILTANDNREAYPMYNEIKFQMRGGKKYASLFHRLKLTNFFVRHSIAAPMASFNTYTRAYAGQGDQARGSFSPYWSSTNTELDPQEFKTMDVLNFWRRFDDPDELTTLEEELKSDPELALLGKNIEDQLFVSQPELLQPAIRYNFLEGIRRYIKDGLRSYSDLLVGERAPSETIFYRIEKRLNDEIVQEFFVPNSPGIDIFEYIDTQVMYGMSTARNDFNRYDYTIYDGRMVIGNDYRRSVSARVDPKGGSRYADAWNFPLRPPRTYDRENPFDPTNPVHTSFAPPLPFDWPEATDEDIRLVRNAARGFEAFTYGDALEVAQERRDEMYSAIRDMWTWYADQPSLVATGDALRTVMEFITDDTPDRFLVALPELRNAIDVDLAVMGDASSPTGIAPPWSTEPTQSPRPLHDASLEVAPQEVQGMTTEEAPLPPTSPHSVIGGATAAGSIITEASSPGAKGPSSPAQPSPASPWPSSPPQEEEERLGWLGSIIDNYLEAVMGPVEWLKSAARTNTLEIDVGWYLPDGSGAPSRPPGSMARQLPGKRMVKIGMLANSKPSVKIIQVPIFSTRPGPGVYLLDKPPAAPQVEFVPYRAVDNQLLVNMNEQANTHIETVPITFTNEEKISKDYHRRQQAANGHIPYPPSGDWSNVPMIFGNDDFPTSFEVYRLDYPPNSYEDFIGNLYHVADLTDGKGVPEVSSASLKDALIPNQKYYYIFRVKDVHGHTSNPTDVYQIELVNNAGAIFLLLKIYEFPEESPINYTKNVQQYIQIKPALLQEIINEERSGLVSSGDAPIPSATGHVIQLGPDGQVVWGKKLKFRFISKKTGRKIDINVDVELNQDPGTPGSTTTGDIIC